ncbi:hypothetical protein HYX10_03235 [Candidatus Woesearchaeota archaeon]|nr:hypothetical protein [Candidatus Woesearchaeota archaeon]
MTNKKAVLLFFILFSLILPTPVNAQPSIADAFFEDQPWPPYGSGTQDLIPRWYIASVWLALGTVVFVTAANIPVFKGTKYKGAVIMFALAFSAIAVAGTTFVNNISALFGAGVLGLAVVAIVALVFLLIGLLTQAIGLGTKIGGEGVRQAAEAAQQAREAAAQHPAQAEARLQDHPAVHGGGVGAGGAPSAPGAAGYAGPGVPAGPAPGGWGGRTPVFPTPAVPGAGGPAATQAVNVANNAAQTAQNASAASAAATEAARNLAKEINTLIGAISERNEAQAAVNANPYDRAAQQRLEKSEASVDRLIGDVKRGDEQVILQEEQANRYDEQLEQYQQAAAEFIEKGEELLGRLSRYDRGLRQAIRQLGTRIGKIHSVAQTMESQIQEQRKLIQELADLVSQLQHQRQPDAALVKAIENIAHRGETGAESLAGEVGSALKQLGGIAKFEREAIPLAGGESVADRRALSDLAIALSLLGVGPAVIGQIASALNQSRAIVPIIDGQYRIISEEGDRLALVRTEVAGAWQLWVQLRKLNRLMVAAIRDGNLPEQMKLFEEMRALVPGFASQTTALATNSHGLAEATVSAELDSGRIQAILRALTNGHRALQRALPAAKPLAALPAETQTRIDERKRQQELREQKIREIEAYEEQMRARRKSSAEAHGLARFEQGRVRSYEGRPGLKEGWQGELRTIYAEDNRRRAIEAHAAAREARLAEFARVRGAQAAAPAPTSQPGRAKADPEQRRLEAQIAMYRQTIARLNQQIKGAREQLPRTRAGGKPRRALYQTLKNLRAELEGNQKKLGIMERQLAQLRTRA